MTAKYRLPCHLYRYLRMRFVLGYFRAQRLILGFQIAATAFKCRILRLDEPDSLLEDRRRAVLVDNFFEKIKHRPVVPRSRATVR